MFARITLPALLAPALLLGACTPGANRGLESAHQPVISRAEYAFDVATQGYDLAPGETERLSGWMNSLNLGYGDRIFVVAGDGYAEGARAAIAQVASRQGLLLSEGAPVTAAAPAPGMARVVITRMQASVPGCPDYRGLDQPNFDAHTSSNFGCATNANLAAMIARPEDLVRGQQAGSEGNPLAAVKAIKAMREAEPTGASGLPGGVSSVSVTGGQ